MAEKTHKTQAEKAAAAKAKSKKRSKEATNEKNTNSASGNSKNDRANKIPVRVISSLVFLGIFILFVVTFFVHDGVLINWLNELIHGLIGNAAFIAAMPVLLYLFCVHAFSGKQPVCMRTICSLVFVACCGMISHLALSTTASVSSVSDLYAGGISGSTAGLIFGGLSLLLELLIGKLLSYIIVIIAALLTLLAGMQITIPSIVRAVQNRPRAEWEEDKKTEHTDPASAIVNFIFNRRIKKKEKTRNTVAEVVEPEQDVHNQREVKTSDKPGSERVNEIMQQIDGDVEEPVAAAGKSIPIENDDPEILPMPSKDVAPIPEQMPVFEPETAIVDAPITTRHAENAATDKVTAKDAVESAAEVAEEIAKADAVLKPEYCYPPIDLLKKISDGVADGTEEMRENTRRLNETLASFKIEAHIINVTRGPSVTRYEVELEKGVRLSKLTTAADDIALSLGATGVRIAAVPGKISVVGIEVPNRAVTTVSLREVIDSAEFSKSKSKSSFAVGKDIGGSSIVGNISKLPHMLIAGTTGSGKSVCMNSIIISLLYKASPDDVKLIMVDPKMVELGIYNGIPHLLIPVVTEPKKAAGSLQWAVTEMLRRYKAMSDAGVRDLESYNSIIESQEVDGVKLPQVVVIIDELADLMLVAAKEVEESICRIAQMGRAAGIHLIIATQRPSADVITGLMKANIPSRIAFAVASAMESRIILDTQGAEKLVGKGDMLYAPIGNGKPKRVQGCFVSDAEVEAVANYVKANSATNYDQQVLEDIEKKAAQTGNKSTSNEMEPNKDETSEDEMLPAAVDVILETGQASVSMLQRRLKLGYARAARIVDEMEKKGIVGPYSGAKPRTILVSKEQWEAMRSGATAQMGFDDMDGTFVDEAVPDDF